MGAQAGGLVTLADGRAGADGSALPLHADAAVLAGSLRRGQRAQVALGTGRVGYLVAETGRLAVNGVAVDTRDGVTITGETTVDIVAAEDARVVLVDVAG